MAAAAGGTEQRASGELNVLRATRSNPARALVVVAFAVSAQLVRTAGDGSLRRLASPHLARCAATRDLALAFLLPSSSQPQPASTPARTALAHSHSLIYLLLASTTGPKAQRTTDTHTANLLPPHSESPPCLLLLPLRRSSYLLALYTYTTRHVGSLACSHHEGETSRASQGAISVQPACLLDSSSLAQSSVRCRCCSVCCSPHPSGVQGNPRVEG